MQKKGVVVVGQKPTRGAGIEFPSRPGFTRIDVTSGSANEFGSGVKATLLSPLFLGPVTDCDGEICNRFENLWQFRKVFPQLKHWDADKNTPTETWMEWRRAGYKQLKNGKGIRTPQEVSELKKIWSQALAAEYNSEDERATAMEKAKWTPSCLWWNGESLDYIVARKRVYVPIYSNLIQENAAFKAIKALVDKGENVLIMDLDGPPLEICPIGMEATLDNFKRMINDPRYVFGHGYVVAALLAEIDITQLCSEDENPSVKKSNEDVN